MTIHLHWRAGMLRGARLLVASLLLLSACAMQAEETAAAEIGVARVNLTPPSSMKAALGGYGARMSKPAIGVHDAVWAKALAVSQGGRRMALVTADVLAFPPRFKAAVVERLSADGWRSDQIMLLPSHSHTSFDMMALHPGNTFGIPQVGVFHPELFAHAASQLAEVIRQAGHNLRPAVVGTAVHAVPGQNRNRRKEGGLHDQDLTVTRIDTTQGRPLAVLVNWTAHPTFMNEEDMLFSGDWPGHLQRTLEALIGEGAVVLYYNGAEGDQSPVPPQGCGSNWERAESYGRGMGIRAWRLWQQIQPRELRQFSCRSVAIPLPKTACHPDFMKTGGAEYGLNEDMMQKFLDALQPKETRSTFVRLGDLVILGVPGEMAAALGLELKTKARTLTGAPAVTIGGLADEWVSYILTADEYRKGGYEASMSFYGETLGATLLEGILRSVPETN